jgi:hypothetical protein
MYGGSTGAYKMLVGKPEVEIHLEDLDIDGKIILKWICKKCDGKT